MIEKCLVACALILTSSIPTLAQMPDRQVGSFLLHSEQDKFGEGTNVVAISPSGENGLILRCLQNTRNVAIYFGTGESHWKNGDTGSVKVKIDLKPVRTFPIVAVGNNLIQITDSEVLVDSVANANDIAFRIVINNITSDVDFPIKQAGVAAEEVNRGCGVGG